MSMKKYSIFLLLLLCCVCAAVAQSNVPDSLLSSINTATYREFAAMLSPDGKQLFFSRYGHPQNIGEKPNADIWVSRQQSNQTWGAAVNLGQPINSDGNEQIVGLNLNADVMLLLNSNTSTLMASYRKGRLWSVPKQQCLGDSSEQLLIRQAHVSADLQILLLCAEDTRAARPDVNIYVAFARATDQWSELQLIGNNVNTTEAEDFAFINSDDRTLYFHKKNNSKPLENGLYSALRLDETWLNWSLPKKIYNDSRACSISASADAQNMVAVFESKAIEVGMVVLPKAVKPSVAYVANLSLANPTIYPKSLIVSHSMNDSTRKSLYPDRNGRLQYLIAEHDNMLCYAETEGFFSSSVLLARGNKALLHLDQDRNNDNISGESVRLEQLQIRLNALNKEISALELRRSDLPDLSLLTQDSEVSAKENMAFNPNLNDLKTQFAIVKGKKDVIVSDDTKITFKDIAPRQAESEQESLLNVDAPINQVKRGLRERYLLQKGTQKDSVLSIKSTAYTEDKTAQRQAIEDVAQQYEGEYLAFEDLDFDLFEDRIRQQLRNEHRGNILKELYNRVIDEVINDTYMRLVDVNDKRTLKPLLNNAKKEVERNIALRLKNIFVQPSVEKILSKNKNTIRIEQQLRKILLEDIKEGLRSEWTSILRKEITWHSELYFKNTLRSYLQSDLLNKKNGRNSVEATENPIRIAEINNNYVDTLIKIQQRNATEAQIIKLYPIQNETVIPLYNVFFKANESTFLPESEIELSRIIDLMRRFPDIMVEIQVHTHGNCSQAFAVQLTQRRATAIMNYLVQYGGIAAERFQANGLGKSFPLNTSHTIEDRLRNQRVELKIKKM